MGEMKKITELLEELYQQSPDSFRPMCPTCGMIPKKDDNAHYCFYCDMTADWCQCDVADMCKCEGK